MSYQKDGPISPPGVPFALTQVVDGDDLRDVYLGNTSVDDSDRKLFNFGVEYARDFDNGWRLEQGFRYQKFDWDYTGFYVSSGAMGSTDPLVAMLGSYQTEESSTFNIDTRFLGNVTTGSVDHKLLFGLDVRRHKYDNAGQFGTETFLVDWRDPDQGVAVPTARSGDRDDLTLTQIGVYAQDELSWDKWRATFGLRYDWAKQTGQSYDLVNSAPTGGPYDARRDDEALTGRIGLSYLMDSGLTPYVSYATSFEPESA